MMLVNMTIELQRFYTSINIQNNPIPCPYRYTNSLPNRPNIVFATTVKVGIRSDTCTYPYYLTEQIDKNRMYRPLTCSGIIKKLNDTMPALSENRSGSLVLRVASNNVVVQSRTEAICSI